MPEVNNWRVTWRNKYEAAVVPHDSLDFAHRIVKGMHVF
jgi:hypothetical protein